jgi:hypothetical protein
LPCGFANRSQSWSRISSSSPTTLPTTASTSSFSPTRSRRKTARSSSTATGRLAIPGHLGQHPLNDQDGNTADEGQDDRIARSNVHTHGTTLFFVAVYACPGPNAISPSFEEKFARLRPAAAGLFDLSFMRHTVQWVELYQGLTIEKCFETIEDDPWFIP